MQKNKRKQSLLPDAPTVFLGDTAAVYIKREQINDENVWSIYNPDGEQIAYTATREAALMVALQNDFNAHSVH